MISNAKKNKKYEFIFFDLDGTLIDSKEGITKSIQFALEKMGYPYPSADDLEWCIGPPLKESFQKLIDNKCEKTLGTAISHYRERFVEKGIYENLIYPGIEKLLSNLNQDGYRLFIATSKPTVIASQILRYFGLASFFEEIYGAELDGTRSDKAELLEYIVSKHEIDSSVLMVGDRKYDVMAAIKNKIDSLGVLYGYGGKNELINAGAKYICETPSEIYQWLHSEPSI